jgi:hypothetical protein
MQALKLGADHYLAKPADAEQILDAYVLSLSCGWGVVTCLFRWIKNSRDEIRIHFHLASLADHGFSRRQ